MVKRKKTPEDDRSKPLESIESPSAQSSETLKRTQPSEADSLGSGSVPSSSAGGSNPLTDSLDDFGTEKTNSSGQSTSDSIEALMGSAEMLLSVAVQLAVQKTPSIPKDEIEHAGKFSPTERSMLRAVAPTAVPHFESTVANPKFGPILFGVALLVIVSGRSRSLVRKYSAAPVKQNRQPATAPVATSAESEHKRAWGPASDAVPVGGFPEPVSTPNGFTFPPKRMSTESAGLTKSE